MTTIWEMWGDQYYRKTDRSTANPLRCIMTHKAQMGTYFQHMSTAMASLCSGHVHVMDKAVGPGKTSFTTLRQDGIWYNQEFPRLKKDGKAVDITAISEDGKTKFVYWSKAKGNAAKRDTQLEYNGHNVTLIESGDAPFAESAWWDHPDAEESFQEIEHYHALQARKAVPKQKNCRAAPADTLNRPGE